MLHNAMGIFLHGKSIKTVRQATRAELVAAIVAEGKTLAEAERTVGIFDGLGADNIVVGNEKFSLKREEK